MIDTPTRRHHTSFFIVASALRAARCSRVETRGFGDQLAMTSVHNHDEETRTYKQWFSCDTYPTSAYFDDETEPKTHITPPHYFATTTAHLLFTCLTLILELAPSFLSTTYNIQKLKKWY